MRLSSLTREIFRQLRRLRKVRRHAFEPILDGMEWLASKHIERRLRVGGGVGLGEGNSHIKMTGVIFGKFEKKP